MKAIDPAVVSDLIDRIYGAAVEPGLWPNFVRELNRVLHGRVAALFVQDTLSADVGLLVVDGQDPTYAESYQKYYAAKNLAFRASAKLSPGAVKREFELVDRETLLRSEFFNDWLLPQELLYGFGSVVERREQTQTDLTVLRSEISGPLTDDELTLVRELTPHVRRAIAIHSRLCSITREQRVALDAIDRLSVGLLLLTGQGQLLYANDFADRQLKEADGVFLVQGRLAAVPNDSMARLVRLIDSAAGHRPEDPGLAGGAMVIPTRSGRHLSVLVCPYRPLEGDFDRIRPAVMVFVGRQRRGEHLHSGMLVQLYRLTPAEAKLAAALAAGKTVAAYAEEAGLTAQTVRSYLKAVFAKTGTHRQAELVATLATDPILQLAARRPSD